MATNKKSHKYSLSMVINYQIYQLILKLMWLVINFIDWIPQGRNSTLPEYQAFSGGGGEEEGGGLIRCCINILPAQKLKISHRL